METADARHRENTTEKFTEYRRRKYSELTQLVSSRRMVYLDMKYWIWLRDPANAPEPAKVQDLLDILKSRMKSGQLLCPLSYTTLLELSKIGSAEVRLSQAQLMDELSGGIGIRNQFEIAEIEILSLLIQHAPPFASMPVDSIWTRIGNIIGEFRPENRELPVGLLARGRKVMFDVDWAMEVQHIARRMDTMLESKSRWTATSSRINEERKKHPRGQQSFEKLFSDELGGLLESLRLPIRNCWSKGASRNGIEISPTDVPEKDVNDLISLLCSGVEKDSSARILPSCRIYAALHAAFRMDDGRNFKANHLPDFDHAALAAAYCDLFLTEKALSDLLHRQQVLAVIPKNCIVLSSIDDAIEALS